MTEITSEVQNAFFVILGFELGSIKNDKSANVNNSVTNSQIVPTNLFTTRTSKYQG